MVNQETEKHYHVYERMKTKSGRKDMYRCIHPDCTHFAPRSMLIGKYARCQFCLTRFVLTPYALELKKPHCGCRKMNQEQRENLAKLGDTVEMQQSVALGLLQAKLSKGLK